MSLAARIYPKEPQPVQPRLHQPDLIDEVTLALAEATRPTLNRDLQPEIGFRPQQPEPPYDSCILGYRFVHYFDLESRTWEAVEVGLTPEDLLHPREADTIMQEKSHCEDASRVYTVLSGILRRVPHAQAVFDVRVDWQVAGFEPCHCPDLVVFYNYPNILGPAPTIYVRDLGLDVRLVFELVSPDDNRVRNNDVTHKVVEYHQIGVPQYIIADVTRARDNSKRMRLISYRWTADGYVRQRLDRHRRVRLNLGDNLNIWLGTYWDGPNHALGLFDGNTGELIPDANQAQLRIAAAREEAVLAHEEATLAREEAAAAREELEALRALLRQHNIDPKQV